METGFEHRSARPRDVVVSQFSRRDHRVLQGISIGIKVAGFKPGLWHLLDV